MAYITSNAPRAVRPVAGWGSAFRSFMHSYVRRLSRLDEVERLNAMSDRQLADMGVDREHIVRHVFRDRLYA